MKTEIQQTELYKKFKEALNIHHDMRPDDNPFVVACCEIAEAYAKQKLDIASVVRGCQCETRIGETTVWCCNQCGLPCEDGWLPTNYAFGSRNVADGAAGKNG